MLTGDKKIFTIPTTDEDTALGADLAACSSVLQERAKAALLEAPLKFEHIARVLENGGDVKVYVEFSMAAGDLTVKVWATPAQNDPTPSSFLPGTSVRWEGEPEKVPLPVQESK